ncbi:MAG: alkaline phosphatase [Gemmatimonadota bacterium]
MPGLPLLVAVTIGWGAEAPANQALPDPAPASHTIFFVADGAGIAHWSAAWLEGDSLAVAAFPVVGLVDTGNTTGSHVESASSATAFAIGERTIYGAIGVGADQEPRPTVLEVAEAGGLATGLVTTTFLLDATPAAFAAHVSSRNQWARIARQMLDQDIEVLMGDGLAWFDSLPIRERYTVVTTPEELRAVDVDEVARVLGLFDIDRVSDPDQRAPSLAEMTGTALAILDRDPDGFFLLVENEHTDHRAHDNAPLATIQAEVADIDRAIRVALDYRARRPETLIVVTGDHETGGLAVVPDSTGALEAEYVTTGHSLELVPLFAIGPGAEAFAGIRTNADVGRLLLERVRGERSAAVVAPSPSSQ